MSTIGELVFDWLFNASAQIGLFAILAAVLSPFIAKAKARYQHCFYLAIFTLCLAAPVFNTLWQTRSSMVAQQQPIQGTEHTDHPFGSGTRYSKGHESINLAPGAKLRSLLCGRCFFFISLIPLQPRPLSSSSPAQRRFVDSLRAKLG